MTDNDLLQLADREIQRLTDENDHGAAVILRELASRLRNLSGKGQTIVTVIDKTPGFPLKGTAADCVASPSQKICFAPAHQRDVIL